VVVTEAQRKVAWLLRRHAEFCRRTSSLYGAVLSKAGDDVESGGPTWAVLQGREGDPEETALALRFMAAVHRVVLEGQAADLAAHYPTAGGGGPRADAWPAFQSTIERHAELLRELVARPCQTNEVGRSAALLPGFLVIVRATGLPLRLLEIGASAGLNLRWDRYRYEGAGVTWGDPASSVRITGAFAVPPPPLDGHVEVVERRGCDPNPLDPADPEDRLTLRASIWADQPDRLRLLEAALEVARSVPAPLDPRSAEPWLATVMARPADRVATVVFHSVVMQYLEDAEREAVRLLLEEAGGRATAANPMAWLRLEPEGDWRRERPHAVRLTMWPGGREAKLAESHPHGRPVRWLGCRDRPARA